MEGILCLLSINANKSNFGSFRAGDGVTSQRGPYYFNENDGSAQPLRATKKDPSGSFI